VSESVLIMTKHGPKWADFLSVTLTKKTKNFLSFALNVKDWPKSGVFRGAF
jgi:hypothetical protein